MKSRRNGNSLFVNYTIFRRLVALWIDWFLIGLIPAVFMGIASSVIQSDDILTVFFVIYFVISFAMIIFFLAYWPSRNYGQTLGKKALGLIILTHADGNPPSLGRLIWRTILILLLGGLEIMLMMFSLVLNLISLVKGEQHYLREGWNLWTRMYREEGDEVYVYMTWHDRLSGTVILRLNKDALNALSVDSD
jgi:uncharacterized RDD family membrane protein YckC